MMMNGMMIFAVAVGGTSLICYVLAIQVADIAGEIGGSSPRQFSDRTVRAFSAPATEAISSGSGGHHSASDHSTGSGDSGTSGDSGGGDSGGGGAMAEVAAAINDAPPRDKDRAYCPAAMRVFRFIPVWIRHQFGIT